MPLVLIGFILLSVASFSAATYVYMLGRSRRGMIGRTNTATSRPPAYTALFGGGVAVGRPESLSLRFARLIPQNWAGNGKTALALVQSGHDSTTAPLTYAGVRVVLLVGVPVVVAIAAPKTTFAHLVLYITGAGIFAALIPSWYLLRSVRLRQTRIRRSLPDALDLLVVCIEAGISLDAAVLRVAKDLGSVHPELASELLVVNRKSNAGMAREDALRALWTRTGVEEVRTLVSHIVQGEKWGTSSGKVLRVYSETLRRQRRQAAEKKAATLPVKMLLPLGLFIFPSIFLILLGPVILNVMAEFNK